MAAKLSWVDPASFAAIESDTHFLYFTKLSGKSRDFYFLVGIHLNKSPNLGNVPHKQGEVTVTWWAETHIVSSMPSLVTIFAAIMTHLCQKSDSIE